MESGEMTTGYHGPKGAVTVTTFDPAINSRVHAVDKMGNVTTVTEFKKDPVKPGLIRTTVVTHSKEYLLQKVNEYIRSLEKKGKQFADRDLIEAGMLQTDMTINALKSAGLKISQDVIDAVNVLIDPGSFVSDYKNWKREQKSGNPLSFLEWRKQQNEKTKPKPRNNTPVLINQPAT